MNALFAKYKEVIERTPDQQSESVRVWTIKKDEVIRVNLVEMRGELRLHKHPDADHSLLLIEGRVRVQVGDQIDIMEKGDFISIPADIPHKYWSLTPTSLLVSMDAPYYKISIPLE